VVELHQLIARSLVLYLFIVGIWAVVSGVRKQAFTPALRGALFIGVGLCVVQAAVGMALVITGFRPLDNLHYLYGASIIVTLPLVASYIVDKKVSRPLVYGVASLFMAGLAIRAITTGGSL
jgi:heme A synthase